MEYIKCMVCLYYMRYFQKCNPFFKIFSDSAKKDKKLVFAVTVWYSVDNQPVTAVYGGGHRATLYSSVVPRLHRRVKETTVPAGMPVEAIRVCVSEKGYSAHNVPLSE